jgi:hypothetical protein
VRIRQAQWRRCRIAPGPLRDGAAWVEQYRRLWQERYDALDDYLRELEEKP